MKMQVGRYFLQLSLIFPYFVFPPPERPVTRTVPVELLFLKGAEEQSFSPVIIQGQEYLLIQNNSDKPYPKTFFELT